jgi:hypothetical protein
MDDSRRELRDGVPLARGGVIERAGTLAALPATAERVIGLARPRPVAWARHGLLAANRALKSVCRIKPTIRCLSRVFGPMEKNIS